MNIDELNKKIQAENDSYNRKANRLQQELLKLKERHQRIIADLQNQKLQAKMQNTNENYFKDVIDELNKYL